MKADFWHQKWDKNEIGFHEAEANKLLRQSIHYLQLMMGARVFLPLCGKTRDIHWLLAQGYRVAGAELSAVAIDALFNDLKLSPTFCARSTFIRYSRCHLRPGGIGGLAREYAPQIYPTYNQY